MMFWNNPYLILILTTMMWGGNAVASRSAPGHISPMVLTAGRWGLAVIVIAVAFGPTIRRERHAMLTHWKALAAYGISGFLMFNVFGYMAGFYTSAINIGIIQGIIPLFVVIGAFIVYKTPVTKLQACGLALSAIGLLILASKGDPATLKALAFNFGDILMLIACLAYSIYTLMLRKRPPLPAFAFFSGCAVAGFVSALPLLAAEFWIGQLRWPTDVIGWSILLYCAILPSIVSQILFVRGVELIGPSRAGLFVNLVPVWASIFGPIMLGETFAPYHAVALGLVLGGIGVAEWGRQHISVKT